MNEPKHNGWQNWHTWTACNWLTVDEQTRKAAERAARTGSASLASLIEAMVMDGQKGLAADLLGDALAMIDYSELSAHLSPTEEAKP